MKTIVQMIVGFLKKEWFLLVTAGVIGLIIFFFESF